ncbi:MAG: hypothetical protein R6V60_02215 [Desulfobacterales bacterium]
MALGTPCDTNITEAARLMDEFAECTGPATAIVPSLRQLPAELPEARPADPLQRATAHHPPRR